MPEDRRTWVYTLKKDELISELESRNIEVSATVDDLRHRLSAYLRQQGSVTKQRGTEIPVEATTAPPPEPEVASQNAVRPLPLPSAIEVVRKWSCYFDGGKNALSFLERVDELRHGYGLQKEQLVQCLPELLRSKALHWYPNNHQDFTTWDEFEVSFRLYFVPP